MDNDYGYLMDIALILASTKVLGLIFKKYQMPAVVGALLAGLIFGPAVLNILHETDFLTRVAELGVIVIMFSAGMDTDIRELKRTGKAGFIVALIGVVVPLLLGAGLMHFFNHSQSVLQNFFIGVILTATSVSITVEALKEMGKLNTKVGNTILAAAIIDDLLGLIALTVVSSMAGADINVWVVFIKIILFFIFAGVFSFLTLKLIKWYIAKVNFQNLHRFPIIAFVFCLIMAYSAEHFFGVADIIGAFTAGLVIANTTKAKYISSKFNTLSYLMLTPIFFAGIGIKVELPEMSWGLAGFTVLLVLVAMLSKLIGCGLGAKTCGFSMRESAQIGFGMACRGEVALIVANKGLSLGLIERVLFGPIIIMVVCAAVFTPILLKLAFRSQETIHHQSNLVDNYEKVNKMDQISEKLLEKH